MEELEYELRKKAETGVCYKCGVENNEIVYADEEKTQGTCIECILENIYNFLG